MKVKSLTVDTLLIASSKISLAFYIKPDLAKKLAIAIQSLATSSVNFLIPSRNTLSPIFRLISNSGLFSINLHSAIQSWYSDFVLELR